MKSLKPPRPFRARHPWRGPVVDVIVAIVLFVCVVYAVWGVLGAIARLP